MKRIFLTALLAGPLFFGGCSGSDADKAQVQRKTITGVETVVAGAKSHAEEVEAAGTVKAANIGVISSKAMGTVTSILVKEGERVRKGQTLLTLDDSDVAQKAAAAEAGLKEASLGLESARRQMEQMEATYQRYQKLHEAKAVSRQEFDNISLQRDQARLGYEAMKESVQRAKASSSEAKVYRGYTRVASPFTGIVSEIKIDEGSMAAPGVPLVVIEDDSSFTIEASLDGRLAGQVRPGTMLRAVAETGAEFKARVIEVMPSIDPATRTFLVKASIKGEGLRTGLFARLLVPGVEREMLTVPVSAIVNKGQLTGVYVADQNNVVSYRLVRTGEKAGDEVEVISGLSEGERVISKGAERAVDGGLLGSSK